MMMTDYNANSIKILSSSEADDILYNKIECLADKYPATSKQFIQRLVEASEMAGCDWDEVEAKYLEKSFLGRVKNEMELMETFAASAPKHQQPVFVPSMLNRK